MTANLQPNLQGVRLQGPKYRLESIYEAEKSILDPKVDSKSKKSILSIVFRLKLTWFALIWWF